MERKRKLNQDSDYTNRYKINSLRNNNSGKVNGIHKIPTNIMQHIALKLHPRDRRSLGKVISTTRQINNNTRKDYLNKLKYANEYAKALDKVSAQRLKKQVKNKTIIRSKRENINFENNAGYTSARSFKFPNHTRITRTYPNGGIHVFELSSNQNLTKIEKPNNLTERLLRSELTGETVFYNGSPDRERIVRRQKQNGTRQIYNGNKGEERLIRIELPNRTRQFYKGNKDQERLIRVEYRNGNSRVYTGRQGEERLIRVEYQNGTKEKYTGHQGEERLIRVEYPNGTKEKYTGRQGEERRIRVENPQP